MKGIFRFAAAAALAALLAGCCACRSYQRKTRRPLEGTLWQLVQLNGAAVNAAQGAFTIRFDPAEQTLSGRGSCNDLRASYAFTPLRALLIAPMTSTRRACPESEREAAFVAALESATHYDMDGPLLLILCEGELRAVFQALPDEPGTETKKGR